MIIPLMTAEIFGMQVPGRLLGVILTAVGIALLGPLAVLGLPGPRNRERRSTV